MQEINLQSMINKYRQQLYGVASIMIVFHHLTFKPSGTLLANAFMLLRVMGAVGVDIFLFLSGYGLVNSYRKGNIINFYIKRLLRIVPTYFVICIPYYIIKDVIFERCGISKFIKDLFIISFWTDGVEIGILLQ